MFAAVALLLATLEESDLALARATASHDVAAFAALLDPGCLFGGPGGWKEGPAAVVEAWKPFLTAGGPLLQWSPDEAHVAAQGDLGVTSGRWMRLAGGSSAGGRYLTVWRRGEDGRGWRVLLDVAVVPPVAGADRKTTRRITSATGDLEATAGTYTRAGAPGGIWASVRRRDPDGPWRTLVETELPAAR